MKVTPVSIELPLKDPDAAYAAVRGPGTYLLESAEGGEKVARYSFIGFNPVAKLTIRGDKIDLETEDPRHEGRKATLCANLHLPQDNSKLRVGTEGPSRTGSPLANLVLKTLNHSGKGPLESLRNIMSQFTLVKGSGARFFGGFVGYFSYDLVRHYVELGEIKDDLREPDCEFILAKNNIIFDHKAKKTLLTQNEFGECDEAKVKKHLRELAASFRFPAFAKPKRRRLSLVPNQTKKQFEKKVRRVVKYAKDGDIIQAVISQRFETDFSGDSFEVFRALKKINPSPYMYHLDFGDRKIVGSSPEMLARVEGRKVVTYPIAGTRKRGETDAEDKKLEAELISDKKERAEHLMLVDLGRNDVGRVAKFGTVKVNKFMSVEKYSHVQHLVSEVEGELVDGKDSFDALKSIFPAGTVSGAPKVRAMEIINDLEPSRRGIYAGAVGYFSFNGNMDTAITIRTLVFEGRKAYMQAGAGIVADSKPEKEYEETISKAKGILKALEGGI